MWYMELEIQLYITVELEIQLYPICGTWNWKYRVAYYVGLEIQLYVVPRTVNT